MINYDYSTQRRREIEMKTDIKNLCVFALKINKSALPAPQKRNPAEAGFPYKTFYSP